MVAHPDAVRDCMPRSELDRAEELQCQTRVGLGVEEGIAWKVRQTTLSENISRTV